MKPFMKNWLVGKLSSSFVSEIIRISILSLIWCVSNSDLFLREPISECPIISLFRFLTLSGLNSGFLLILSTYFFASGIYCSFNKRVEATLFSSFCQLKMLDKTLGKVFGNIGVPLLFRCSLLPFKCCGFRALEWSINKKFLSKQSSVKHLFTSFAFAMKRSFRVMTFEMVTSCLSLFKLDTTSTIDFAIRSGDRWSGDRWNTLPLLENIQHLMKSFIFIWLDIKFE